MAFYRIKSLKYGTYYNGGRGLTNPDFKDDLAMPDVRNDYTNPVLKKEWEDYYIRYRKRNQEYQDLLKKANLDEDDYAGRLALMKQANVERDYCKFDDEGQIWPSERGAQVKLSKLTKTTKKIRSKTSTQVLYGNENSANWKVVKGKMVDE
jgi:hypothetical protein